MDYQLKIQGGQLVLGSSEQIKSFEDSFRRAVRIEDRAARLNAVSQVVLPPIRKVAPYMEWTNRFFVQRPEDAYDHVRFAVDEYTAVAFMSSADGGIEYTRPWRKYETTTWRMIRAGLEIPWDADRWGWDVISQKMMEVAEEFARKRDDLRRPLLDAAAVSQAGHIPTVASSLSKASIDSIIQTSNRLGFPVKQVAVNAGRIMDMSGWTFPSNSMFSGSMPDSIGANIFTRLFDPGYGDLLWIANHTIPWDYLYLSGPPSNVGEQFMGGTRSASDQDIDHDLDKHNWRQETAAVVRGSQWVWRLQIT